MAEPKLAAQGARLDTLDRTPFHHRAAHTPLPVSHSVSRDKQDMPFHLVCTPLECGRKSDYVEKRHGKCGNSTRTVATARN